MNDTVLDLGVGVNRLNGFGEALQSTDTGNQDIFDAPVVEVREYTEPVVSTFLV
ncbi:hypothetical protein SAMN02745729_11260 [Marinobacterium iners DSM 11526]|uniref:Uncharacterized protein n=1 Tax=Marinobacterium iners DSM 11526 TaxID=1122198 RepID=A0A1H4FS41_9GAMM|nr:hypothetical protein SAMN02745729_11260 [Marinobacterium iners DSM 11526]